MGTFGQTVVFLDRDGVINRDSAHYIKSWDEFFFLPRSLKAIEVLTQNGFSIIIISNQSAVGRKMITPTELEVIHEQMLKTIHSKGGIITDIFFCPHLPEEDCNCRKPKPGMIHRAQKAHRIHLASACMVGDSEKDIECAKMAGCGTVVLVRTGNGIRAEKVLIQRQIFPDYVASDLYDAACWMILHLKTQKRV
jgi:D-glycero-D-manno-heptose 1,7-bisphosphate phosphatase